MGGQSTPPGWASGGDTSIPREPPPGATLGFPSKDLSEVWKQYRLSGSRDERSNVYSVHEASLQ
jgi:hypothetical protein